MSDNAVKMAKIIMIGIVIVGSEIIVCKYGSEFGYEFPDGSKIYLNPSTVLQKTVQNKKSPVQPEEQKTVIVTDKKPPENAKPSKKEG